MEIKTTEGEIEISDSAFYGTLEFEVHNLQEMTWDIFNINKEEAIKVVNHLKDVFDL